MHDFLILEQNVVFQVKLNSIVSCLKVTGTLQSSLYHLLCLGANGHQGAAEVQCGPSIREQARTPAAESNAAHRSQGCASN